MPNMDAYRVGAHWVAAAFACTNLATLNLSSTAGKAGDTVTVTGSDTYGTPARASYQILGPNGQSVVTPPASAAAATVADAPSSSGIIALTVGLGVLGLALFGAGFIAFVRQTRAAATAATAPVRRS